MYFWLLFLRDGKDGRTWQESVVLLLLNPLPHGVRGECQRFLISVTKKWWMSIFMVLLVHHDTFAVVELTVG